MATPILRRRLISLFSDNNSNLLRSSHFTFSLYFSTETSRQPLDASEVTKFLIKNHDFSRDAAERIASLTRLKTPENAHSILSFLKEMGFSTAQLEKILKSSPCLLSAHLDSSIKPKFDAFRDLGFTSDQILDIISRQSRVLIHSAPRILSSVSVLINVLGSTAAAAKFIKASGLFLCDMETTFLPNVEYLRSCGVQMEQILQLTTSPQLFLHKPENVRKFVEKADEMGSNRSLKNYVHAIRVVSSFTDEGWERKLKALRDLGFSKDDIMRAFRNTPKVFGSSAEKMKRVADVLLATGKYDVVSITSSPIVFQYSMEKRIRPRVDVLMALEEKNLIVNWPSLSSMIIYPDADFFRKFVAPHLDEVGHLWSVVGDNKGGSESLKKS